MKTKENAAVTGGQEKVSALSKLWLCLADCLCGTANGLLTGGGMSYFFVNYMGMDEKLASIVWIIFGIWNAFNDPLFGYLSDRTKSKLGRRIPYYPLRLGVLRAVLHHHLVQMADRRVADRAVHPDADDAVFV